MSIFRANSHKFHEWQKIKIIGNDSKKEFSNYFKIIISLASSCHTIKNPSVLQNIGVFFFIFLFSFLQKIIQCIVLGALCYPSCPLGSGWVAYNGSCYLFSNHKLKYSEAFAECGQLDSDLLYFYTEADRVMSCYKFCISFHLVN